MGFPSHFLRALSIGLFLRLVLFAEFTLAVLLSALILEFPSKAVKSFVLIYDNCPSLFFMLLLSLDFG